MSKVVILLLLLVCACAAYAQSAEDPNVTQGSLFAYGKRGQMRGDCPLKNTSVKTDISGFIARVRVRQEFENPFSTPIEAVYTFPLSQNGAVDDMTMTIGSRTIRGKIMKRDEARQVYETAKSQGQAASLLDQERPNIFTQSVANIMPGEKIVVEISYVETLTYEDGAYEFVFPMTVAPRYKPASVKDSAKISPPVAVDRPGHNISIEVNLNAGVPVEGIRSTSHEIQQVNFSPTTSKITLKDETTIPNKDFILRYDVTGKKIEDAVLATRDARGGFFTLVLQPPDQFISQDITPKEIVFVLDTSGSMSGFPIEKAKEAMKLSLDGLNPNDTFNLITFAGDTHILFDGPVAATQGNLERAQAFLDSRSGAGGTEMMSAIKAALDPSDSKDHIRVVCFMTDGEVGNEEEIISEVQKHPKARVFSFGIGNSVNRYLLDKIAEAGNGEAEYVSLQDDGSKAAKKFYERVRTPLLTDITIDWNGMPVTDTYPAKLPDLFSAKPVIVSGRFTKASNGTIRLNGQVAGQPYSREIVVNLPEAETANDALATLWARKRIDDLTDKRAALSDGKDLPKLNPVDQEITRLGLEYRLLTYNTSFVAVEERVVNQNGKPVTIQVPVAIPEGVDPAMSGTNAGDISIARLNQTGYYSNGPGGGGGGGGRSETVTVAAGSVQGLYSTNAARSGLRSPKKKSNKASGSGSGTGVGYGSGSGSGRGAPPVAMAKVLTSPPATVNVTATDPEVGTAKLLSPEMIRTQKLKDKLHTWVYGLVDRLEKKTAAGLNESHFVHDGKAEIKITLSEKSPDVIEKVRNAGFEIASEKGNEITGRIAIGKLAGLAEIEEVKLILPKL